MAIKATIYKAHLQIADMDRSVYVDHSVTIARHPSETDERMMIRLLAMALLLPPDNLHGTLEFAKDLWETDEPGLWHKDLTGQLMHWVEVGQPDERRMAKACGRARRVSIYAYGTSAPVWWAGLQGKVARLSNLAVWQWPADQSQALAAMAQRSMQLQVTVQDGQLWVGDGRQSVEVQPVVLKEASR